VRTIGRGAAGASDFAARRRVSRSSSAERASPESPKLASPFII